MNEILPISMTVMNWEALSKMGELVGLKFPYSEHEILGYIQCLCKLVKKDPIKVLRSGDPAILRTITLSCATTFEPQVILQHTELNSIGDSGLWILSGRLHTWQRAAIDLCSREHSEKLRNLFNRIIVFLDTLKLHELFALYRRRKVGKSFVLERKI